MSVSCDYKIELIAMIYIIWINDYVESLAGGRSDRARIKGVICRLLVICIVRKAHQVHTGIYLCRYFSWFSCVIKKRSKTEAWDQSPTYAAACKCRKHCRNYSWIVLSITERGTLLQVTEVKSRSKAKHKNIKILSSYMHQDI